MLMNPNFTMIKKIDYRKFGASVFFEKIKKTLEKNAPTEFEMLFLSNAIIAISEVIVSFSCN